MKRVMWSNVWNWTSSNGNGSRVHLTEAQALEGKTLCGKAFPRSKGHPEGWRVCRGCLKKAKMTVEDMRKLPFVASSVD